MYAKKRGRAKIIASVVVGLGLDDNGQEIQAQIVFIRYIMLALRTHEEQDPRTISQLFFCVVMNWSKSTLQRQFYCDWTV